MTTLSPSRETTISAPRVRLGALALALSGILFLLYPVLRPFSDEVSLQGAAAFASPFWVLAHILAVVGFILLALSLLGLHNALQKTTVERLVSVALVLTWIGVGFTLPYYGAEIFALHAIGQEAVRQQSVALLTLVNAVRSGTPAAGSWPHPGRDCGVAIRHALTMEWYCVRSWICALYSTIFRHPTHQSGPWGPGCDWMHLARVEYDTRPAAAQGFVKVT